MNFSLDPICYGDNDFLIGICIFVITLIALLTCGMFLKKRVKFALASTIAVSVIFTVGLFIAILSLGLESKGQRYLRRGGEYVGNQAEKTISNENKAATPNSQRNDYIGTYLYNQPDNSGRAEKLIIILNEDETAIAKATVRGEEKTYYGSWHDFNKGTIELKFSDAYFTWNGRTTSLLDAWLNWGEAINVDGSIIKDGYLYANYDMAKAKNPEHRVKLERTK